MIPFQSPTDDILFSLRHVAGADAVPGWDDDLASDVLGHFAGFAEEVIAPLNAVGDQQGARLENGRVRMPDGFGPAYTQLAEGGWQGLTAPEAYGGMQAPAPLAAAVSEVFSGANHAMQMVCNLVPGAIGTLMTYGTQAQKDQWIPQLAAGEALSTMCLTEPGAGSDLARIGCKAVQTGDHWQITGQKIFISGGDQDMSPGILHLVLARSGPPDSGLKGLSLYLCQPGQGVTVTRIEEKLGLHASPTCQMSFDAAPAELIGAEGEGLRAMFTVMNHARIDVTLQGVAHAARARQIARAYADDRVQGRRADGSDAVLSDHPDVRRMLDVQTALTLGCRAMAHISLVELETGAPPPLADFLTSLCKATATDAGIRAADLGIQILGGYGYLEEYQLSQTWRDARITAIYEGTNGIHHRTLATRGLKPGGGADQFEALILRLWPYAPLGDWQALRDRLRADADTALAQAHRFAEASGHLFLRAVWHRIEAVAAHHPTPAEIARVADGVLRGDLL